MNKRSGFSMIELMIALGIGTIVIMAAMFLNKQVDDSASHIMLKGDVELSELAIKGIVTKDMLNSKPSFDYIEFKGAGVGCSSIEFDIWAYTEKNNKCRVEYNMDIDTNPIFYMMIMKTTRKDRVSETAIPRSFYSGSKTPTFDSKKFNNFLRTETKLGQDKAFLKFQITAGDYSILTYLTDSAGSYSGQKIKNNLSLTPFDFKKTLASHCDIKEPETLDEYLRCVPDFGGGAQLIIDPVKIIRYRVEESKKYAQKGLMGLFRGVAILNAAGEMVFREIKLTDYLKEFKIIRPDTSSALLNFSVKLEKATRLKN